MKIEHFSKEGKHYTNEDSLSVRQLASDRVVAVLADGMGGLCFGKMAADLIVDAISEYTSTYLGQSSIQELIGNALEYADAIIAQKSKETYSKIGAAVALVFIDGNIAHFTWLGNVRIYISEEGKAKLLTADHSLDAGYGKFLLTRCIKGKGVRADWPYQEISVKAGSKLILCTDGLYKQVGLTQLFTIALPILEEFEDDASIIRIEF